MYDSAVAFDRYRLDVVKSWPEGEMKNTLVAAIESSLRRQGGHGLTEQPYAAEPPSARSFTGRILKQF